MNTLRETLQALTIGFVDSIVDAIRRTPIEEIDGAAGGAPQKSVKVATVKSAARAMRPDKGARLARRSAEQIDQVIDQIVTVLRKHPEGLRAEHIRQELDLDVREVPRLLRTGVESKKLVILSGQKRATTYGLPGSRKVAKVVSKPAAKKATPKAKKPAPKAAKKPIKKAAPKPIKKAAPKPPTKKAA